MEEVASPMVRFLAVLSIVVCVICAGIGIHLLRGIQFHSKSDKADKLEKHQPVIACRCVDTDD